MQYAHVSVVDVVLASGDEFIGAEIRQSAGLSNGWNKKAAAHPLTVNS
jgi:hypothetical protein